MSHADEIDKALIVEPPIRYLPRGRSGGKRIAWIDGFVAVNTLIDQRLKHRLRLRASECPFCSYSQSRV